MALLFVVDLSDPLVRRSPGMTQTDAIEVPLAQTQNSPRRDVTTDTESAIFTITDPNTPKTTQAVVEKATFPTPQSPVFEKVKLDQEPRRLSPRPMQARTEYRERNYHDNRSYHHDGIPHNQNTYVSAPRFDQESAQMVKHKPPTGCKCMHTTRKSPSVPKKPTNYNIVREESEAPMRPGYVANVAKRWDERTRRSDNNRSPIEGLNTMV